MNKILEVLLKDRYMTNSYDQFWSFISDMVDDLSETEYQTLMDIIRTII